MYTCRQLKDKLNNDLDCNVFNYMGRGLFVRGEFDGTYNDYNDTENSFPDYLNRYINLYTATMMYTHFDYLLLYNILKNMMENDCV